MRLRRAARRARRAARARQSAAFQTGRAWRRDGIGRTKEKPAGLTAGLSLRHAETGLAKIEAVGVHHLGPRLDEVAHELFLIAALGIDLGGRPQLAVRPEDEIGACGAPLFVTPA